MAEEIDFENGRNSNFEGLVTLTLTFDPAIRHVVLRQSSTSSYIPNFIQIEETFVDGRTYGWTDIFPLYIIRSTLGSRPKNGVSKCTVFTGPPSVTVHCTVLYCRPNCFQNVVFASTSNGRPHVRPRSSTRSRLTSNWIITVWTVVQTVLTATFNSSGDR